MPRQCSLVVIVVVVVVVVVVVPTLYSNSVVICIFVQNSALQTKMLMAEVHESFMKLLVEFFDFNFKYFYSFTLSYFNGKTVPCINYPIVKKMFPGICSTFFFH